MLDVRKVVLVLILVFGSVTSLGAADAAPSHRWIPLFNGKDLDGWEAKITGFEPGENFGDTFRVEDGLLKVSYDKYQAFDGKFGHLFYAREKFSNYRLRVEYRFVGDQLAGGPGWAFRNSGIMVHGQSARSMNRDQNFPVSIEVQLLGGKGEGERSTANLCTPGTHVEMNGDLVTRHCTSSQSATFHGDQWVTVEVDVRGDEVIQHLVNGETVLTYQKPQLDANDRHAKQLIRDGNRMLHDGYISLQSESHPIEFRKVEIMKRDR